MQQATITSGLVFRQQLGLSWEPRENEENEKDDVAEYNTKLLQMLPLFEERSSERGEEDVERTQELTRVERKLDLLLELVSEWIRTNRDQPPQVAVTLGAEAVSWLQEAESPLPEQQVWISLQIDQRLPAPLRLPARVVSVEAERNCHRVMVRFENISDTTAELLEKFIFRQHRREIARMRAQSPGD